MNGACIEVWYNAHDRSWVVQPWTSDQQSYSSDYCGDYQWALSVPPR